MTTTKADNSRAPALSMEAALNCDDILQQILLRVPVRSLIRLKCVSKVWLELISSPFFGHTHATCQDSHAVSGFYFYACGCFKIQPVPLHSHQSLPSLSFFYDALHIKHGFNILDSCNGLMLCTHGYWKLCVFNPTTRKYTLIPQSPHDELCFDHYILAFDPTKSLYYKLVLVSLDRECYHTSYVIDIYSSEDKSWRSVEIDRDAYSRFKGIIRAFWDGAVHWLNSTDNHVQFNLDTEKLLETPLPRKASDESKFCFLGECGGDLLLVENDISNMAGYRIHEMTRGTPHWRLKMSMHIRPEESLSLTKTEFMSIFRDHTMAISY